MFAEPDTENSFIELYNEENGVYSVVEDLRSMIEQNIDKVKGYSVFKFRITKFSANGSGAFAAVGRTHGAEFHDAYERHRHLTAAAVAQTEGTAARITQ